MTGICKGLGKDTHAAGMEGDMTYKGKDFGGGHTLMLTGKRKTGTGPGKRREK